MNPFIISVHRSLVWIVRKSLLIYLNLRRIAVHITLKIRNKNYTNVQTVAKCKFDSLKLSTHTVGRSSDIGRFFWQKIFFAGNFDRFFAKNLPILEDLPTVCTKLKLNWRRLLLEKNWISPKFHFFLHFESRMKNRSSLSMHTKIHSNDRQYGCMVCDQKFVQKINLINHLKVHNTTKTHSCTECGKRYGFFLISNKNTVQHLMAAQWHYTNIHLFLCVFFLPQFCWSITIATPLYPAHKYSII